MAEVRITVDGEHALTVEQAAARYGIQHGSMRAELTRLKGTLAPVCYLDGRKPLYLAAALDQAMSDRPGKGKAKRPTPA